MIIKPDFKTWIAFCYEPTGPASTEAFQFRNCLSPCIGIDDKPYLITFNQFIFSRETFTIDIPACLIIKTQWRVITLRIGRNHLNIYS